MTRQNIDIEQLVTWALRDQGLGWGAPGERSREVAGLEDLGTLVDESEHGWHPSAALFTDDDAMVVYRAINLCLAPQRVLLVLHGRSGTRPEGAMDVLGEPEQLRNKRGQLMWIYDQPGNRRSPRRPLYDRLGHAARREAIEFARAQWCLWHQGLCDLVDVVNNGMPGLAGMTQRQATGPAVAAAPWFDPVPVVHGLDPEVAAARAAVAAEAGQRVEDRGAALGRRYDLDELRAAAMAPVLAAAPTVWGDGPRGVVLGTVAEGVAEAGRQALREKFGVGQRSGNSG